MLGSVHWELVNSKEKLMWNVTDLFILRKMIIFSFNLFILTALSYQACQLEKLGEMQMTETETRLMTK